MTIRQRWFTPLLLALASLAATAAARADGADAEQRVREANDQLRELLRADQSDPAIAARTAELVNSLLDYEGLAQRALVNHWERLTPEQRAEFLDLFKQLVAKSYRENLKETLDNIAIDFLGWEATANDSVLVRTRVRKIQTRRNRRAETIIVYEMHQVGGIWKMIDCVTDDVSLVQSYRDQFNEIIGSAQTPEAGWADLIGRMRRKLQEG
jgi:phospholipid transport system substrate-binding protein